MFDDKTWERYGALGGVWFVVLTVVGVILAGTPPARTDSVADITEWFVDNDGAIQIAAFLTALGIIGLVWWFGTLWRMMANTEGGTPRVAIIALVGFVISGIGAITSFSINTATASAIDLVGEGSAFFFEMAMVAVAFSSLGDVILALAVSALIMRSEMLPKWVGQLGYLVAVASLIASLGIASDAEFFGVVGLIAFLIWSLWILAISVLSYQKLSATA